MVIRIRRGETKSVARQFIRDGGPVDLTGASIAFAAKWKLDDPDADAILSKSVGSGVVLSDPAAGFFAIEFSRTETLALVAGDYYYDVRVTEPATGTVTTVDDGALSVVAGSEA